MYLSCVRPFTTNAEISASRMISLVQGFGAKDSTQNPPPMNFAMPMFKLGGIVPKLSVATNASSDVLASARLAQKISYPYLVLRSNIASACSLSYVGGSQNSYLDAVAYLTVSYQLDDFTFSLDSPLVFTVLRPYTLTEIRSSIHFPNGELAESILGENSACIYKIVFKNPPIPTWMHLEHVTSSCEFLECMCHEKCFWKWAIFPRTLPPYFSTTLVNFTWTFDAAAIVTEWKESHFILFQRCAPSYSPFLQCAWRKLLAWMNPGWQWIATSWGRRG